MMQRVKIMKKVLFVCTGNTCRSPMAELLFNKLSREKGIDAVAQSAGLCTIEGLLINDNSEEVLKELGIGSDFFRSADIYDLDLSSYDLIVGMTEEHLAELRAEGVAEEKLCMLNAEKGGIADPYGFGVDVYRVCREEIVNSLEEIFKLL